MPLSSVVGAQSIVRPGVCTSSTRPASPYDGQVIYETDTDKTLVWNGSGWVFLSTSRANPGGLDLIVAETSFSSTNTVTIDNVFTSTYTNYKIVLNLSGASANNNITAQLRVGGVTAATNYDHQYHTADGTTASGTGYAGRTTATTNALVAISGGQTATNPFSIDIFNPAVAATTAFYSFGVRSLAASDYISLWHFAAQHRTATAYDGIIFTGASSMTMSGTYSVYGYVK